MSSGFTSTKCNKPKSLSICKFVSHRKKVDFHAVTWTEHFANVSAIFFDLSTDALSASHDSGASAMRIDRERAKTSYYFNPVTKSKQKIKT